MNALECTALGRRYGANWALRDCSLRIEAGSVVALVGANGAGKTTLLELIVGLLAPTTGRVKIFSQTPADALSEVAFVAQDHPLYRGFTVAEMLRFGQATNPRWQPSIALDHLAALDIPLDRRIGRLSGGQRAQVAVSLALAKRADLLVLDEPVASLDPVARRDLMSLLMADAAEYGTTVMLSSHVVAELERVCDHLIVLANGAVHLDGPVDWLIARHRRLIGPSSARLPAGVGRVLERRDPGRQTVLLAELEAPVLDPAWEQHPVSLENLVLGYLRRPDLGLRHWHDGDRVDQDRVDQDRVDGARGVVR